MAAVRRTNTQPELLLRSGLHRSGLRFRVDFPIRFERRIIRPDVAFTKVRVAVFLDGCFWHMCPTHGSMPATNIDFWKRKLEGNAARDREQTRLLTEQGWVVIRIWEHEPVDSAVDTVRTVVSSRRDHNML